MNNNGSSNYGSNNGGYGGSGGMGGNSNYGGSSSGNYGGNGGMNNGMNNNGQKEDYLDKGLDAVEKKLGQMTGKNIDPHKYRAQNEKITDKIRGFFEKSTGKKLPSKFSN